MTAYEGTVLRRLIPHRCGSRIASAPKEPGTIQSQLLAETITSTSDGGQEDRHQTTDTLITALRRADKALRFDLDGIWSARRGTYRVLYRVNEDKREVVILRIEHRRDAYRPL